MTNTAATIRNARLGASLSKRRLSILLGVSRPAILSWENGQRPSARNAKKLEAFFNLPSGSLGA